MPDVPDPQRPTAPADVPLARLRWLLGLAGVLGLASIAILHTSAARDAAVAALSALAVLAALVLAVLRARLEATVARLADAARTDPLTGLANRRAFGEALGVEVERSRRTGEPLILLLADVDRFKQLNESRGHATGDLVLRAVADVLRCGVRRIDFVARLGGGEFALLLPATDTDAGVAVAERLRRAVTRRLAGDGLVLTLSAGVAAATDAEIAEDLLQRAQRALDAAKRTGRDRVVRDDAADELAGPGESAARREALLLLAESLDLRDPSTAAHSQTVGDLSAEIAERVGLTPDRVEAVRLAGILHDIGKLAVPDAILHKPGPLTAEEVCVVRRHPDLGARLLEGAGLHDLSEWVRSHHERVDGTGYPRGLPAGAIPLEGRILAVADAYEAMTTGRVYQSALDPAEAVAELRRCAGTQFDVTLVEHLAAAIGGPLPQALAA